MCLQNSKQHNPGTAIYLWGVVQQRLQTTVLNNVCKAFCNIRLRQQHEVQLGKQWLERAEEASTADENEVEMDKVRRSNFLKGLELLDQACMQIDETLMALTCFI
jgi:DNA-directed RNA polymerase III subunit RPC3